MIRINVIKNNIIKYQKGINRKYNNIKKKISKDEVDSKENLIKLNNFRIKYYIKHDDEKKALEIFYEMERTKSINIITYNTIINNYFTNKNINMAMNIFYNLLEKKKEIKIDLKLISSVIKILLRLNQKEIGFIIIYILALKIFNKELINENIYPDIKIFNRILEKLSSDEDKRIIHYYKLVKKKKIHY
jgi:pentatricopeptide repeat protein